MDPYNSLQPYSRAAMDNTSYEEGYKTPPRLFVPCVPAQNLRKDLHKYFSTFGDIVDIIYQTKDRERSNNTGNDPTIGSGYCILVLRDAETSDKILQANPHFYDGRRLEIQPYLTGKELQRQNEIQNQTRLFLKNFPKYTNSTQVEQWLKNIGIPKPKLIHPVPKKHNPFQDSRHIQAKSITFNIHLQGLDEALFLLESCDLKYRESKIWAEVKKPEPNRNNDTGFILRDFPIQSMHYKQHMHYKQQIGSLGSRVDSDSLGSNKPILRMVQKQQFRQVNTEIHVQPKTSHKPPIARNHSSRIGTDFINSDLDPAKRQGHASSSNSYSRHLKFASIEISQDSSPLEAHPKKSTKTLSDDFRKDVEGQTFSKHLKLRTTYTNINSQNKYQDDTTNIRFNVIAPTKRSTESRVAVFDSSKKVSTVQL